MTHAGNLGNSLVHALSCDGCADKYTAKDREAINLASLNARAFDDAALAEFRRDAEARAYGDNDPHAINPFAWAAIADIYAAEQERRSAVAS